VTHDDLWQTQLKRHSFWQFTERCDRHGSTVAVKQNVKQEPIATSPQSIQTAAPQEPHIPSIERRKQRDSLPRDPRGWHHKPFESSQRGYERDDQARQGKRRTRGTRSQTVSRAHTNE
jgi:hypothetical protein